MSRHSLSHLSRQALLSGLGEAESRQQSGDADVLAHLGEVDYRRLYAQLGYPSLFTWCVHARHYSEDVAVKRIRAARAARRYPAILDMLADGRLHLTAIELLSHRLTPRNAKQLLAAAVHRSKREIQAMLAERFPQADVPTVVQAVPATNSLPAPAPVNNWAAAAVSAVDAAVAAAREAAAPAPPPGPGATPAAVPAPATVQATAAPPPAWSRVTPTAPQRYAVQVTMDEAMHADLIRAQELLGPQDSDHDRVRAVFRRALRELVTTLEKRKYAATDRPRQQRGEPAKGEHIPAQVKREVRKRDEDRCSWLTEDGRRCAARSQLQYDHIKPVGKGGGSTARNVRLLCPAHNQLAAELEYGEGFMHRIRERTRDAAERWHRPAAPVAPPSPDPLSCAPAQAARTAPPCP